MRAVLMTAVGGPEVFELRELPEPELAGEHDVRVRLRAAGINPVDYKLRSYGTFARSLPVILGCDGAGVVEATGPAVTRVRPGDEVYFCDGGFGPVPAPTRVKVIDERYPAHKPERPLFAEAAGGAAGDDHRMEALRERARVGEGQFAGWGGAGGSGTCRCKSPGWRGRGSRRSRQARRPSWPPRSARSVHRLARGHRRQAARLDRMDGADVVHDTVGGPTFTASFQLARPYGDLVSNVESPWADSAVTATHNRNLRVSFT
jgi:NADPH2:quinone reductase